MKTMAWIIALIVLSVPASAEWSAEIHIASRHFGDTPKHLTEYNEDHIGLGIVYRTGRVSLAGGAIDKNSIGNRSRYLNAGLDLYGESSKVGVDLDIADGYYEYLGDDGIAYRYKDFDYLLTTGLYVRLGGVLKFRYTDSRLTLSYIF